MNGRPRGLLVGAVAWELVWSPENCNDNWSGCGPRAQSPGGCEAIRRLRRGHTGMTARTRLLTNQSRGTLSVVPLSVASLGVDVRRTLKLGSPRREHDRPIPGVIMAVASAYLPGLRGTARRRARRAVVRAGACSAHLLQQERRNS